MWGVTVASHFDRSASGPTALRDLSSLPLVVAPMAGGPTTVELVVAAAGAGALGFLAGGYKAAAGMAAEMAAVRDAGVGAFGVNVFVPGHPAADPGRVEAYVASLETDATSLGATVGAPTWDDDDYGGKVDALVAQPPAAVSFTFGIPDVEVVRSLQAAGSIVLLTVTTPEEAAQAVRVGPDALCLQGAEAGAHRGSLANDDAPDQDRPVRALLASVRQHTRLPLVAAGGVGGPDDVTELLRVAQIWSRPGRRFCVVPRAERHSRTRTRWPTRHSKERRSRGPSAAAGREHWSMRWSGPIRGRPRPTPRSTTPPARYGRPRRRPATHST